MVVEQAEQLTRGGASRGGGGGLPAHQLVHQRRLERTVAQIERGERDATAGCARALQQGRSEVGGRAEQARGGWRHREARQAVRREAGEYAVRLGRDGGLYGLDKARAQAAAAAAAPPPCRLNPKSAHRRGRACQDSRRIQQRKA